MATLRICIHAMTDRGEPKRLYRTVETPEFTPETDRYFGKFKLPDLTVQDLQLEYIDQDENYQRFIVEPAHKAELYLIFTYEPAPLAAKSAVSPGQLATRPKKVTKLEAVKHASAYVLKDASERIKVDYAAVMAERWESLKHQTVAQIVEQVMHTLSIAYRARNAVWDEVLNNRAAALPVADTSPLLSHES